MLLPCLGKGAPSCYLNILDKLQKQVCRTVGPTLGAFLEPLDHRRNVARCSSELAELVRLTYSRLRSTCYSNGLVMFLSPFLDVVRMSVNSFFPRSARL